MENKYTVEDILERMFAYYNVSSISGLSKVINTSPKTISNWKIRNSISAVKKKCRELGIFQEIFNSTGAAIVSDNHGNIAGTVFGSQYSEKKSLNNDIDDGLLKLVYLATQTLNSEQIQELKKMIKQFMMDSVI
ncbi:hypothetical protein MLC35_00945 [Sulfurimonas sp. NW7]|uniref:hypothetical protein n=1 Tax=Sulfurimonas sp. NW7 TaxID=2922727 RepID=UPI003DAA07E5